MQHINTNRRDRNCLKQIVYLANKYKHLEVSPDVFKDSHGRTYRYDVTFKRLIIKDQLGHRTLVRHYNDFENEICNGGGIHNKPKMAR